MVNFDRCQLDAFHTYGGSDKKLCRIYNGKPYMLKVADKLEAKGLATSYSNSIYSEYICCHILEIMGIDVQKTVLGTITTESQTTGKKERKPVVGCQNFLIDNCNLIEFAVIEDDALEEKVGKIPKLRDINYIFKTNCSHYFTSEKLREQAEQRYWDTFVLDAYFGNFDRHHHNFGYIAEKTPDGDMNISIAPIYDCGSCLYPQLSEASLDTILNSEEEINARIYKFPTAALLLDGGRKANYYEFINSLKNEDCNKAVLRIFPLIQKHQDEIRAFIDNQNYLSLARKNFYNVILKKRFEKIIEPAYTRLMEKTNGYDYDSDEEVENER